MSDNKEWWEDKDADQLPKYIKLDDRVYPINDAISLGKITADCLAATRKEYLDYKNRGKQWARSFRKCQPKRFEKK